MLLAILAMATAVSLAVAADSLITNGSMVTLNDAAGFVSGLPAQIVSSSETFVSHLIGRLAHGGMQQLAATVALIILTWYLITGLLAWRRLSHIPSASWLSNFSYLWLAKTTYSGRQYWVHRDLHKKHDSPLVRIGPNEVMTDDPDIVRKISSARSGYARSDWYTTGRFNPYHENMFTVLEPKAHTKFKSRVAHAYSNREIPDMEGGVDQQVSTLLRVMRERYAAQGRLLELGVFSCYFTMDVITRLAFGQEFGYMDAEKDHYRFLGGVRDLWPQMSTSADVPWIRNFLFSKPFLRLFGPKTGDKEGFGALMTVAGKYVSRRFDGGSPEKKDMLASFIHHGLNQQECEAEGLFMIVAGTESTASTIRSILIHAITTPLVYARLKEEVKAAISAGQASDPITFEEAKKLPYLQAVIYEGIRIRTPLLGLLPKIVPAGGDTFHGKFLPAGTALCTNNSSLLRSKAMFGDDSDIFRPERFMELPEEKRSAMERDVDLAFGSGQWQCVGKTIATMEINKVVFELFRHFHLQLATPTEPCDVINYGIFLETNMMFKITDDL